MTQDELILVLWMLTAILGLLLFLVIEYTGRCTWCRKLCWLDWMKHFNTLCIDCYWQYKDKLL